MVDVILVEESPSESALAFVAIALRRPGTRVAEVRSLTEAVQLVQRQDAPVPLVILGWRALQQSLAPALALIGRRADVIGFASNLGAAGERALKAGVLLIYEKPVEWAAYINCVESILRDWLPRSDARSMSA